MSNLKISQLSNGGQLQSVDQIPIARSGNNYYLSGSTLTAQFVQTASVTASVQTWLSNPTSSNLASALTDETGSGAAVFQNSPTLTGSPIAPTQLATDNSTLIATTAMVQAAIANYATTGASFRGVYDASGNVFPSSGGSGTAGAIQSGDFWTISVAGTLGGIPAYVGNTLLAITDSPGQTAANWAISATNPVIGPSSSINQAITIYDGTTGKIVKNSGLLVSGASLDVLTASTVSSTLFSGVSANLTGLTASQAVVTDASKNLASLGYSTTATATNLAERDGNANIFANNFIGNVVSVVSAGTQTNLTPASARDQILTGTLAQTFRLPNCNSSGMAVGALFNFNNNSTGLLTVNDFGGTTICTVPTGGKTQFICSDVSTSSGVWECHAFLAHGVTFGTGGLNTTGTLSASGATFSGLTASSAVATDASKNFVSVTNTGTGNNVLQTNPVLVTPTIGAATGTSLQLSGLTASSAVATDSSKNLVSVTNTGTGNNVLATSPTISTSLVMAGTTSGTISISVPAVAGTNTLKLPAGTTDFSATGGTSQVVKQTTSGGAFTVGQLAFSDISGTAATTQGGTGLTTNCQFLARLSGNDADVTGDGTIFTIGSGNAFTEIFDTSNNFNTNGTFTAPVTGKYQFNATFAGASGDANVLIFNLVTSNRTYQLFKCNPLYVRAFGTEITVSGSVLADMDASDIAYLTIQCSGGTKVDDVNTNTTFSGKLLSA